MFLNLYSDDAVAAVDLLLTASPPKWTSLSVLSLFSPNKNSLSKNRALLSLPSVSADERVRRTAAWPQAIGRIGLCSPSPIIYGPSSASIVGTNSDTVGWICTARCKVVYGALAYIMSRTPWIASSPPTPRVAAPKIASVERDSFQIDHSVWSTPGVRARTGQAVSLACWRRRWRHRDHWREAATLLKLLELWAAVRDDLHVVRFTTSPQCESLFEQRSEHRGVSCLPLTAWGQGAGRPQVFRSLALFHGPQHYVASAAGRVRLHSIWKRFWRLSRSGVFETFFEALASSCRCSTRPSSARMCRRPAQALGRSRGGFSTKIHLKTDLDRKVPLPTTPDAPPLRPGPGAESLRRDCVLRWRRPPARKHHRYPRREFCA